MMLQIVTVIADTIVKLATIGGICYGWRIMWQYWHARLTVLGLEPDKILGIEKTKEIA